MTDRQTESFNLAPLHVSARTNKLLACVATLSFSVLNACGGDSKSPRPTPDAVSAPFECKSTKYIQFGNNSTQEPYIVAEVTDRDGMPVQADTFVVRGIGTKLERTLPVAEDNHALITLSPALAEVAVAAVIDGKIDHCATLRRPAAPLAPLIP